MFLAFYINRHFVDVFWALLYASDVERRTLIYTLGGEMHYSVIDACEIEQADVNEF